MRRARSASRQRRQIPDVQPSNRFTSVPDEISYKKSDGTVRDYLNVEDAMSLQQTHQRANDKLRVDPEIMCANSNFGGATCVADVFWQTPTPECQRILCNKRSNNQMILRNLFQMMQDGILITLFSDDVRTKNLRLLQNRLKQKIEAKTFEDHENGSKTKTLMKKPKELDAVLLNMVSVTYHESETYFELSFDAQTNTWSLQSMGPADEYHKIIPGDQRSRLHQEISKDPNIQALVARDEIMRFTLSFTSADVDETILHIWRNNDVSTIVPVFPIQHNNSQVLLKKSEWTLDVWDGKLTAIFHFEIGHDTPLRHRYYGPK